MKKLGRNFLYLMLGQGFSRLGNNFFTLALLWYVLEETGSSMYVGLTAMLLTIPNILSMFTGAIVDRVNRWNLMVSVELIQIILSFSLAYIGWYYEVSLLLLVIVTFLIQTAGSFFGPAENAVIPLLVSDKENLTMANSLNQLITMIAKIVGLASGGILLTFLGPFTLIFINGITFLCSLLSILAISRGSLMNDCENENYEVENSKSLFNEWKLGVNTVAKNKSLRKIIPIAILVNFSLAPLMSLNPAWVKDILKLNSSAYGFVEASLFVGVIVGVIAVNVLYKIIPYHRLLPISLFIMASSVIFLSLVPFYSVTLSCMLIFGIAAGVINTGIFTIMQMTTPNALLGRVSGILIGATNISLPFGMAIGSIISSNIPIAYIFLSGGALAMIGALIAINLPHLTNDGSFTHEDNDLKVVTQSS